VHARRRDGRSDRRLGDSDESTEAAFFAVECDGRRGEQLRVFAREFRFAHEIARDRIVECGHVGIPEFECVRADGIFEIRPHVGCKEALLHRGIERCDTGRSAIELRLSRAKIVAARVLAVAQLGEVRPRFPGPPRAVPSIERRAPSGDARRGVEVRVDSRVRFGERGIARC